MTHEHDDHTMRRLGIAAIVALIVGSMGWVGASVQGLTRATNSLHETSAINTLKIEQIQAAVKPLPTIAQQVVELQYQVNDLERRQSKDDEFRARHGGDGGTQ